MDEMERIVKQLVEQVKVLAESVSMLIQRSEVLYKMQEERLNVLPQLVERQQAAIEEIETTDEALKESLNDLDGGIDDLAKVTSALLVIQQQQNAMMGGNATQPLPATQQE